MPPAKKKPISRQLGTGIRVAAFTLGLLSVLVSLLLCLVFGPSALVLSVFGFLFVYVGVTGSPRTWFTSIANQDPEWDRDIVNGASPEPKYLRYRWIDYVLLLAMAVLGFLSIPLFNRLAALGIINIDWTIVSAAVVISTGISAYTWQTREDGQEGVVTWLALLLFGVGTIVIAMASHSFRVPFLGAMLAYTGAWGILRAFLIRTLHITHRLSAK